MQLLSGSFDPSFFLNKPLLYAYKRVLPTLPLPKIEVSVKTYLASVKPLQTAEEFAATEAEAKDFLANEGELKSNTLVLFFIFYILKIRGGGRGVNSRPRSTVSTLR